MVKVEGLSCAKQLNVTRSKLTVTTQLSDVTFLMWQHVSTSKVHIHISGIKYIKGIVYKTLKELYKMVYNSFYVFYTTGLKVTLWGRNTLPHYRYNIYKLRYAIYFSFYKTNTTG